MNQQPKSPEERYESLTRRLQNLYEESQSLFYQEGGDLEPAFAKINTLLPSLKDKYETGRLVRDDVVDLAQAVTGLRIMIQKKKQMAALAAFLHASISITKSKFPPKMGIEEAYHNARLLKALADPFRLLILSILTQHEGDVCVFEIVDGFDREQPTISHHLRILRNAGLAEYTKKGLWAYYYIRRDTLVKARNVIEQLLDESPKDNQLTPAEAQVLQFLEAGFGSRDISREMKITEEMALAHIKNGFRKTSVYKKLDEVREEP